MHKQDGTEVAARVKGAKGKQGLVCAEGIWVKQGMLHQKKKRYGWKCKKALGAWQLGRMMQPDTRKPLMAYPLSAQICQPFLKKPAAQPVP